EATLDAQRRTLYAPNWAKTEVVRAHEVVVCEGYTDVIGWFQAGIPRAVATCGTALTEEHCKALSNFAKRIVLAYDADAAGQNATTRVYEWEKTHSAEVVVAAMPPGADPGQMAKEDPEALRVAIANARPFLAFRVDRVLLGADLSAPERRALVADRAMAVVAEHPSDIARDQYVMYVSDRCQIDADLLRNRLDQLRRNPEERQALLQDRGTASKKTVEEQAPATTRPLRLDPSLRPGLEALRIAVHFPERVAHRLEPALFLDPVQRRSFEALLEAESLQAAVDDADAEVAALLRQLIVDEPVVDVNDLGDPVEASIVQLVRTAARRSLDRLTARSRVEPASLGELNAEAAKVKRLMELLEFPASTESAEAALVSWITQQEGA
ncbi:MAG: toprim domain-containing protein, partial [Actinomycetota bacterium]